MEITIAAAALVVGLASTASVAAQDSSPAPSSILVTRDIAVELLPQPAPPAATDPVEPSESMTVPPVLTKHELLAKYVLSTIGPPGWLSATVKGSFDQWRGAPPEWGNGWSGFSKRWASDFASSAIGSTTKYAVARLYREDPSFVPCDCVGVGPRLSHAVISPFTARKRDGHRVFSLATVAGFVAEDVVPAATWYPATNGTRDGLVNAAFDLVSKVAVDVFREFVHIRRKAPGR